MGYGGVYGQGNFRIRNLGLIPTAPLFKALGTLRVPGCSCCIDLLHGAMSMSLAFNHSNLSCRIGECAATRRKMPLDQNNIAYAKSLSFPALAHMSVLLA